jgi:UDP-N-acetylmuramoyl-tripeptide--D-alanyl-D-alanine ligase
MKGVLSLYSPRFSRTVVYMLQASEYDVAAYLNWLLRTDDFSRVMHRKQLVVTKPAGLLLAFMRLGMLAQLVFAAYLFQRNIHMAVIELIFLVLFVLSAPVVWANLVVVPLVLGRWLIIRPYHLVRVRASKKGFAGHQAVKIAVAGSYGKTTMKEILLAVLSEGKKVAATPANKNVAISHANFARSLSGDEDVLIIEYGEGAPGDIKRFTKITQPDIGIITGLAPAHLDKYKTLQKAGEDIFSLADYLGGKNVYVNTEADGVKSFIKPGYLLFNSQKAGDWTVEGIKVSLDGLSFKIQKGDKVLQIKSRLLGKHQVAPLAMAAVLADRLGLSERQIEKGVTTVPAFEHRMKPYQLSGAWIIDDTYNGNIEGMKAGLELLKNLPAKRKIYVTPGLVDQGAESGKIHRELGSEIAKAAPDLVVLMKHSVTDDIVEGLGDFKGQVVIEDDPLNFYTNLDKLVAAGDLLLMQNDWPDNYK